MMHITMTDPELQLLREIEEGHTQKSISVTYAFCIRDHRDAVDWHKINKAVVSRWSRSGLLRVKRMAWKLIEEQHAAAVG